MRGSAERPSPPEHVSCGAVDGMQREGCTTLDGHAAGHPVHLPPDEGLSVGPSFRPPSAVGIEISTTAAEGLASSDVAAHLRGRLTCSIGEAAKLLDIGRSTAYAAAHDGSLPVLHISNRILVSVPRLLAMLGMGDTQADREGS